MELKGVIRNYIAKRLFGYGQSGDFSYVDQFTGPAKDIKLLGQYAGVTYRCINTIAEAVAGQYSPYVYTMTVQGKKQTVPNHPLLQLLQQPNPDVSYYQLLEGMSTFMEQFGEYFLYMVPGSLSGYANGVKEIYLLRPDKMGMVIDKNTGDLLGYNYNTGVAGGKIPFTPDEIVHDMTFNPKNAYRGYSTVEAALDYIQTESEVSRFTRNYFRNNAAMSGVLNVNGKVSRDAWNKFVRQWRERYAGVENAGKVALVRDSQVSFTPTGSSVNDMQLDQLKQTTVDQILMMFRRPKGLFGMESDQGLGRASVETLEYIFAKWTIDNKLSRIDDTLQKCLVKYYAKGSAGQMIGHVNIIPDDKEYLLNFYNQGVDRWITRQEIREKDPELQNNLIAGADQLFTTIQQMPLEDAGAQVAPTTSTSSAEKITFVKSAKKKVSAKTLSTAPTKKKPTA
jgi:HK97 family phage portal protein